MNSVNASPDSLGLAGAPLVTGSEGAQLHPTGLASRTAPPTLSPSLVPASKLSSLHAPGVLADKHYRSLLKAISWRATGTLDTILISFLLTGKIRLAVSIGVVEVFTKITLFYLHERLWNKIPLGRAKPPEDYAI